MKTVIFRELLPKAISLFLFVLTVAVSSQAQTEKTLKKEQIQAALDEAYTKFKDVKDGKNADYIKELANVDPNIFGMQS
jgi:glutaminase